MNQKRLASGQELTQEQIDNAVIAQAEDESAWEEPVRVERSRDVSLKIPAELAGRAAFLARAHRAADMAEWITRIVRERIELEETAFAEAKRELARGRA